MADFGSLDKFLDDVDVRFEFAGKQYEETFPFARVAAFKAYEADYERRLNADEVETTERRAATYKAVAVLFGGEFDVDAWQFRKLPKDHFIHQLIKDGASFTLIDRVVSGIYAKFHWNDEIAVQFVKTYDLGKALEAVVAQSKANTDQETQPERGETTEGDSATSEG